MISKCDMCGSSIVNSKCSCGEWGSADDMKDHPIKKSLELFHEMRKFTLTSDMPHLGCAVVFFRGDYMDCKDVENFIRSMKGRPYFEDEQ